MASVHQIRGSIDHKLDGWEKNAIALEAQINDSRATVLERIEVQKQRTSDALDRAREVFNATTSLGPDIKARVLTDLDYLKIQLALGKIETRQAYQEQRKSIAQAVARFETDLDAGASAADRAMDAVIDEWVDEEIELEAEIDAAEIQWSHEQQELHQEWEAHKQEMKDRLLEFREQMSAKQFISEDKLDAFVEEAGLGFSRIQKAFRNLLG